MERIILIGLAALVLSACGNKQFVKKPEQSQDQFRNDMNYCKGEALALGTTETVCRKSICAVRRPDKCPMRTACCKWVTNRPDNAVL